MNIKHPFIPLLIFCLFLTTNILRGSDTYEGKRIAEIEYKGLVNNDVMEIRSVINARKNSSLDLTIIDEDIKALYNLDLFEDIIVDVVETEKGLVLTYIFVELPFIREIVIKGNRRIKDNGVKNKILLKEESVFRVNEVYIDVDNIVELYEQKGYPSTTVSWEVKEVIEKDKKSGETYRAVDLIFNIEESKKRVIRTLSFSGIDPENEKALRKVIETRERGSKLSRGFFKESEFELDKDRIERYYADKGYVDARIIKVDMETGLDEEENREDMHITIYIDEGEEYIYSGVEITGNVVFTEEELFSQITLEEGLVFNQTEWEIGLQKIRMLLSNSGYIYARVDIDQKKDTDNLTLAYTIVITENIRAHVENIFIIGNEKTKDFVIEREITIREGEVFNSSKLLRTRDKLLGLQYFGSVAWEMKPGTEEGLVDLIFLVEEQRTGLFSFGLTYSTTAQSIAFYEEVSENNFLGRGLRLYEKVQLGLPQQVVEVGLDEPWLFNTPTSAGITFAWSRTKYEDNYTWDPDNPNTLPDGTQIPDGVTYTENPDGSFELDYENADLISYVNTTYQLAFRLGRRFADYYGLNSELSFSVFRNLSESELLPFDDGLREQYDDGYPWYWKNYLKLTAYRDTRDIPYFATRGSYLKQDIYFYGAVLGGYSSYLRLNTEMNLNIRTFSKFVLAARLNFGFILPYLGKPLRVDDTDLLRVDTVFEGRGWGNPSQFGSLYTLRGESELNFSLEYRYPIAERYVWGLVFFDASGLYYKPKDFTIDPRELWYSVGLGASAVIPGLPIRIYLTRRFKYDKSQQRMRLANSNDFLRDWDFVLAVAGYF